MECEDDNDDPLNQSDQIEGNGKNENVVKKIRKFQNDDEEEIGWTHEYEETIIRELKNFPCLWDTTLPTFSKRNVCDPSRKHIVFMLKQNHPTASKEIHEKLFTQSSVSRKIRNLRLAYKKIKNRDGFNSKWRHFRQLSFLESSGAYADHDNNKLSDRDFDYGDTMYQPPFISIMNSDNDDRASVSPIIKVERIGTKRFRTESTEVTENTSRIQECRCHSVFKFAQTVMDQLPTDQQKKFTVDMTKLLLKYQENNL